MNIILLFTLLSVAIIVIANIWVVNRVQTKKWLKTASITDVVSHELFDANMRCVIDDLKNQRAKDEVKAQDKGGRLKSHPIEHLIDEGVFNSKDMKELFIHSLQKTLIGYSRRERAFIRDVGMMAFNRTMIQLQRKAGMKGGEK